MTALDVSQIRSALSKFLNLEPEIKRKKTRNLFLLKPYSTVNFVSANDHVDMTTVIICECNILKYINKTPASLKHNLLI